MPRTNIVQHARKSPGSCQVCHTPIQVGDPYKWAKPRYRGKVVVCSKCQITPSMVSSSKMTTIYEAQYSVSKEIAEASDIDTIASSLESFAEEVRGVGQEYQESADNQREYFPDSSVADDNEEKAQQLDSWADELSDTADTIRSEFSDVEVLQSELDELDDTKEDYASESDRLSDEIEDRLEEARSRVEDAIGECPL